VESIQSSSRQSPSIDSILITCKTTPIPITYTTLDKDMKLSLAILACIATSVVAGPLKYPRDSPFTDPTCKLSKAVTPGTPLSVLFPLANILGSIVGPTVKAAIGADNEERLDKLADNLCVLVQSRSPQKCPILHIAWNFTDVDRFLLLSNSQQEPAGQRGICQELLQALRDLAQEATPAGQVKKYNCLLNLLCV
jgi:hypothetical protein